MFYWISSRRQWGYLPDAAKKRPHLMTAFPAPQPEVPRHVVCPRCEAPPPSSALIRGPRPWGRKNDGNSVSRHKRRRANRRARPKSNPDACRHCRRTHPFRAPDFCPLPHRSVCPAPSLPPRPSTAVESGPTEFASKMYGKNFLFEGK